MAHVLPQLPQRAPVEFAMSLVCVYRSFYPDAEMMRSVLEGSGIPAWIAGSGGGYRLTVGALGEGRVMVRPEDEEAARELLTSIRDDTA
jgi:hypothetical protein